MCHSSPILSRCKKNQADIITETEELFSCNQRESLKENGERFFLKKGPKRGRNRVENVCEMNALNDKHSYDSGARVNHSGGDSFCMETQ